MISESMKAPRVAVVNDSCAVPDESKDQPWLVRLPQLRDVSNEKSSLPNCGPLSLS
jgi:hypothetical protein